MAGDWLKIEASTPDKPEVFEIATQCKISTADAFGRLFLVWRLFDQHTESGNASNVTWAYLDHVVGVSGFAEAMHAVGWLEGGSDGAAGVTLPNFARHNGNTAKNRALTAKRVATHKKRKANDEVTDIALPREEKRRSKRTSPSPSLNGHKRKPETQAPDAFEITEPMWSWATEQGVAHERVEAETAKFLDHHKAKASKFSDWQAAWRTWMRKAVEFSAARRH